LTRSSMPYDIKIHWGKQTKNVGCNISTTIYLIRVHMYGKLSDISAS